MQLSQSSSNNISIAVWVGKLIAGWLAMSIVSYDLKGFVKKQRRTEVDFGLIRIGGWRQPLSG